MYAHFFFSLLSLSASHARPWPLQPPFRDVVVKAIAGITALEGTLTQNGAEASRILYDLNVILSVWPSAGAKRYKHVDVKQCIAIYLDSEMEATPFTGVAMLWLAREIAVAGARDIPLLRLLGVIFALKGVRFWGASLLFMLDSNAIWKEDANCIDAWSCIDGKAPRHISILGDTRTMSAFHVFF